MPHDKRPLLALLFFVGKHVVALMLLAAVAAGAGTLVAPRLPLAARCAVGLAVWGQTLFVLAIIGQLRALPIAILALALIAFGARTLERRGLPRRALLAVAPVLIATFTLALLPPLAFDETLYHLPFIRALASSGALRFLPDLRFPAFPQMHELLCTPMLLFFGDTSTHLVALFEMTLIVALLVEWGRASQSGWLAAALFAGSPLVILLATITYVDAALALFVTAGFYCLDRRHLTPAALLLGTACSVKYLGGYFAVAALVMLLVSHRRDALRFAIICAAAALPMTLWITAMTGNPVFPFYGTSLWAMHFPLPATQRLINTLRLPWDITFARERMNAQPPITPLLTLAFAFALLRRGRARGVAILALIYAIAFAFLPRDSRYLVPLLPLMSIAAAEALPKKRWLPWMAIAPGFAYALYALAVRGLPPVTPAAREAMLTRRVPEYAAVRRAGAETIYVCHAEQLKDYAAGRLLGDFAGPYAYDRVLAPPLAAHLRAIGASFYLVSKRNCSARDMTGMQLVYEDAGAQLWRIQR